jgi:hypothetical protein
MAEYQYKGYTADIYEDRAPYDFTFMPVEPKFKVSLHSDFIRCNSEWCSESEAKTLKHMYIKWFEQNVDKHVNKLK